MSSIFTVSLLLVLVTSKDLSQNFLPTICSSFSTHPIGCTPHDKSLEAVTVVFRHCERTTTFDIPQLQNANISTEGKLTSKGKEGSLQLGSFLQCRYGKFLLSSPTPTVNITSSNTSRTVETAAAVLEGLNINVPIHVIPIDEDNRILRKETLCPSYKKSMSTYKSSAVLPRPNIVELISNVTSEVKSYADVFRVYDTVVVKHCQFDVPLPSWFSALDLYPFYAHHFIGWVHDQQTARLYNGPFLHDILVSLMKGKKSMNLYSAHDVTLSTMMEVMEIYDSSSPPPYNAALILELHKSRDTHEVRVFYGGDERKTLNQLSLPWCPTPCHLTSFTERMTQFSIDDQLWAEECKLDVL